VDGAAGGLVALLGLSNGVEFGLELLLALSVRGVLVVRAGDVKLGFASVLSALANAVLRNALAMQVPMNRVCGYGQVAYRKNRNMNLPASLAQQCAPSRPWQGPLCICRHLASRA
jgi:hypothetical protein